MWVTCHVLTSLFRNKFHFGSRLLAPYTHRYTYRSLLGMSQAVHRSRPRQVYYYFSREALFGLQRLFVSVEQKKNKFNFGPLLLPLDYWSDVLYFPPHPHHPNVVSSLPARGTISGCCWDEIPPNGAGRAILAFIGVSGPNRAPITTAGTVCDGRSANENMFILLHNRQSCGMKHISSRL